MNLGIETETLEFKKSTGELKEAMNSISAILNKHQQGEIYFGVKPDGTVIGPVSYTHLDVYKRQVLSGRFGNTQTGPES